MRLNKRKALALIMVIAMVASLLSACGGGGESEPEEVVRIINPLTGSEEFDANGQRSIAIVVENAPDARPQWGLDDEEYSPDIVLQGEVEGGITRTLWMYADYTKLPEIVGPIRSARPPYIRFSELFDSIFIHWGQSTTENGYVGANTVFKEDGVDHINQMSYTDPVGLYDRDETRSTSSEHRGILYGAKVQDAIKDKKFRTESEDYSGLNFAEVAGPMGEKTCGEATLEYSRLTESTSWKYNEEDELYHCYDFDNDFTRDNLIILFDKTEYQEKTNYHGNGYSVNYCDYKLGGGEGKVISKGTVIDITWAVEDGKLVLRLPVTDEQMEEYEQAKADAEEGEEVEAPVGELVYLNPGKTWIGWASSNEGGSLSLKELPKPEPEETEEAADDAE